MLVTVIILLTAVWATEAQHGTNCAPGRHVITHLFEWRWVDIAAECETYLGPKGFCGVQISPPNEHRIIPESNPNAHFDRYEAKTRPWYERYQPVSYKLSSRSGTEAQLVDMIKRCNAVNVRIYVDAVINHMTGAGAYGTGSAGSIWNSASLSFPGVPYTALDFHRACDINDYGNEYEVRNCRLVSLVDLNIGKNYVREKIAGYMNNLTRFGVAGFRVDASKHMHPNDLKAITSKLNALNTTYFPAGTKPFIFQEVIDMGGEGITSNDYVVVGRVTEFRYGKELARLFRKDVQLKHIRSFGSSWGMVHTNNAVVFVDNHDNQRGHGGGGNIITFRDSRLYKMVNAFMLAWPYGFTRVMSSYDWPQNYENGKDKNDWIGPPAEGNDVMNTKPVTIRDDGTCGNDWICEHRWRQISNMVAFRNVVTGQEVNNWWDNMANQIAFSRGNKGFIAINNDGACLAKLLETGLPPGTYCDIISGDYLGAHCSGREVRVYEDGSAFIDIPNWLEDPVLAIHVGSRISDDPKYGQTDRVEVRDFQRTVILMERQTTMGQQLFFRGGIDVGRRSACKTNTSVCAIPIRYRPIGSSAHYRSYKDWCVGDKTLDWGGAEMGQGRSDGEESFGSPAVWTTNNSSQPGYHSLNRYGNHYWMLDVDMDCSKTVGGWFELKAVVKTQNIAVIAWEENVEQNSPEVTGSGQVTLPFCSANHVLKCGKVNVIHFNDGGLEIHNF